VPGDWLDDEPFSFGHAVWNTLGGNRFSSETLHATFQRCMHRCCLTCQINMLALYNVGPAVEGTLSGVEKHCG
jgi:hypothetical protein